MPELRFELATLESTCLFLLLLSRCQPVIPEAALVQAGGEDTEWIIRQAATQCANEC